MLISSIGLSVLLLNCEAQETDINNLVHQKGYKTSQPGDIPYYIKVGQGSQTLILIPGLGFDASVFSDFMELNKSNYTMYAVTIPGYGKTLAPPMPPATTSYGEQSWNQAVLTGLIKLIHTENLKKPLIVGHFVQGTQLALSIGIGYPDQVGGIIVMGGPAKFIAIVNGKPQEFPLASSITYIDNYTAPKWFKSITKAAFDAGNYPPEVYSLDSSIGAGLWKESASVSLPVMIRYICEFFASDIKEDLAKIKCPVLILRALFKEEVLLNPANNYLRPQFIDSWTDVPTKNTLIQIIDIPNAASFVWKDNPLQVQKEIEIFLRRFKN